MNKLTIFNYEGNTVRTVMKDGSPWWVLRDVCSVLEIGNSRDVMARLDSDEKGVDIIDTPGGKQEVSIINESGLYSVILVSRKPEAKKFKRWVTHEVLPSIRRHGLYATDELLANPDFLIKALQELKAERAKNLELTTTISIQEQQIAEMKPKASYYDVVDRLSLKPYRYHKCHQRDLVHQEHIVSFEDCPLH
jgi:anti-repressor protein